MKYITTLLLLITIQIFGGIGIGESANTPLPVELSSFTASIEENRVIFQWTTANEINNHGFEIERTVEAIDRNPKSEYIVLGFVSGSGNSNSPKVYSFRDESIVPIPELSESIQSNNNNIIFSSARITCYSKGI